MFRRYYLSLFAGLLVISPAFAATAAFIPGYEIAPDYPQTALDRSIEGDVKVGCILQSDGRFSACELRSESPEGYGFGERAVAAASRARLDIVASSLEGKIGKLLVLPIAFRLEDAPPPGQDAAGLDIFAEDADLAPEDRAARQVPAGASPDSACPDEANCGVLN